MRFGFRAVLEGRDLAGWVALSRREPHGSNAEGKATPKATVPGYERATAWVSIGGSSTCTPAGGGGPVRTPVTVPSPPRRGHRPAQEPDGTAQREGVPPRTAGGGRSLNRTAPGR